MLHLTISLPALFLVLLLGVVMFASSNVAHSAPSAVVQSDVEALIFRNPGQNGSRDMRTTSGAGDNLGGIRIYADGALSNPPQTAALQFFGNGHTVFPCQAFIDSGSHANAAILFRTAASGGVAERMRVAANGNVGVGTSSPQTRFHVNGSAWISGDTTPLPTSAGIGIIIGSTGGLGYISAWDYGPAFQGRPLHINKDGGNVGIGTGNDTPSARLTVRGPDEDPGSRAFHVTNSAGQTALTVVDGPDGGFVGLGQFAEFDAATTHVCHRIALFPIPADYLATCTSAAEYVPTIDAGHGVPETADLVSFVSSVANPYDDHHSPFVVGMSVTSCDPGLLGFMVNPESGADGKKVNDAYLPLAIYGSFPANVTMEGGAIRRGDPITSSSTPGAGMKATGACKTIGYALEDADEDGTIQVFANTGESTASTVQRLQEQVETLSQQNAILVQQNAALEARLAAIEQRLNGAAAPLAAAR